MMTYQINSSVKISIDYSFDDVANGHDRAALYPLLHLDLAESCD